MVRAYFWRDHWGSRAHPPRAFKKPVVNHRSARPQPRESTDLASAWGPAVVAKVAQGSCARGRPLPRRTHYRSAILGRPAARDGSCGGGGVAGVERRGRPRSSRYTGWLRRVCRGNCGEATAATEELAKRYARDSRRSTPERNTGFADIRCAASRARGDPAAFRPGRKLT
jgi:hypothetical protein